MNLKKIVIALCTNKRPVLLADAMNSLSKVICPSNFTLEFILIDNDISKTGKPVFDSLVNYLPFKSEYYLEAKKGITFARNRALLEASKREADYLAFFDDDAIVSPEWLNNLMHYSTADDLSILTGPQLSVFDKNCPDWATKIIYFNPRRYPCGSKLRWAATNNIVIPMKLYTKYGISFDSSLRYSGGSDQCLCMEARMVGFSIIWVDTAIVREKVTLERANFKWVLNRSFRYGSTGFFMHYKEKGYIYAFILSTLKSIYYILSGVWKVFFSHPKNKLNKIEGVCLLARGMGWISGIFNKKHNEYVNR
ncbi:glycosyltransferase [Edwardsiella tarda]|uniref:glycosyltransferase family 2 protein n=1 Tax=Edwardsiella tarda TaxID=636 RepID=UPI00351BF5BD